MTVIKSITNHPWSFETYREDIQRATRRGVVKEDHDAAQEVFRWARRARVTDRARILEEILDTIAPVPQAMIGNNKGGGFLRVDIEYRGRD